MKKFLLIVVVTGLCAGIWLFRETLSPSLAKAIRGIGTQTARADTSSKPEEGAPPSAGARGGSRAGSPASQGSAGGRGAEMGPVPVIVGDVVRRDVPIFLNGLGNVQGYNTVTVRSRVDGQLEKVAFGEGQDVTEGELLAQIDPKPFQAALEQAKARREQNVALLTNAELELKRDTALLKGDAGTAQKVDTQKATVEQLKATLKADDAAIEAAKVQLGYATIFSPITGRTGIRAIDPGNVVRAADPAGIVVITQLKPISIVFTISEQHLPLIQGEAAKAALPVFALDRSNSKQVAQGTLTVIDNQIDTATGTIRLKATFPNEDLRLWPGQFTNVRLQVSIFKDAISVPASVVQRGPMGTYAYTISPENTAELRPLSVQRIEDGFALIEKGLEPGEKVIVDGHFRVQPGARVKAAESKGATAAGSKQARGGKTGDSKQAGP